MIGFYNYTVILTYIGTIFGFTGITFVLGGDIKSALICLMIAGFCDMFDGKIASTMKSRSKSAKKFGIQIDSLSDLICFGALPASIGYLCGARSIFALIVSAAFLLGALIRLAWFNVNEEERQETETECRKTYLGLPVTSSAVIIPFFAGLLNMLDLPLDKIFPVILLAVAILFITPFKMKKPALVGKIVMILLGILSLTLVLLGL